MDDDRQDRLAVSKFYEIDRTSGLKKEQKAIFQELRV
jgi:hypothetical protein